MATKKKIESAPAPASPAAKEPTPEEIAAENARKRKEYKESLVKLRKSSCTVSVPPELVKSYKAQGFENVD